MSLLNSNMLNSNELWGGVVAKKIKDLHPWTDSEPYKNAYERCEQLKKKMNII